MDVLALARAHGIELRTGKAGSYKTLCPQCSHTRKKNHDRCLSVRIDETGIGWRCFNCNWTGGEIDDLGNAQKVARRSGADGENSRTYGMLLRQARSGWVSGSR